MIYPTSINARLYVPMCSMQLSKSASFYKTTAWFWFDAERLSSAVNILEMNT